MPGTARGGEATVEQNCAQKVCTYWTRGVLKGGPSMDIHMLYCRTVIAILMDLDIFALFAIM